MAEDWAAIAAEVNGGLGEVGQEVTIATPAIDGAYDPMTDTVIGGSAPIVQHGSGSQKSYSARSIDGTVIQQGDVQFMLSPLKTDGSPISAPVADRDTLTKLDGPWAIKHVDTVAPAGVPVLFKLQLRRG
ncbi:hypothetical protein [Phenylobacterium sp.]|uniref:hypothetical protein n=1 Tax=Phenylobacterium sp. TaxID=1871053 RepID=UPI0027308040|nr:hypothetical protein [Phenylobacterium sp.]MDP1599014.1 hypothetical protein [Phenylobacterium sp.]MDP3590442.1 hypothetical protein [Phenylobacterium sp.]